MGWNRISRIARRLSGGMLLALSLALGLTPAAHSQVTIEVNNGIIEASLGVSGTVAGTATNLAGRIGVADLPFTGTLMDQVFSTTQQSYVTVLIDGGPPTPGSNADTQTTPGWALIFGDVGSNALNASTAGQLTNQGAWVTGYPRIVGNKIVARWTTLPGGNPNFPIPPIEIELTISLVRDMACFEFRVKNNDTRSHTVGLRFTQDINKPLNGSAGKDMPDGPIIVPGVTQLCTETELIGSVVPPWWRAHYPINTSTVGGVLQGSIAGTRITRPDRVVFGDPTNVGFPLWTIGPLDPSVNFCVRPGDAAVSLYYSPRNYLPGQQTTNERPAVVTYYGRNKATIDFEDPWPAGVEADFSLKFDPDLPAGRQLTPNPLKVTAFIHNSRTFTLQNVSATITLPAGLALAAGETATKTLPAIAAGGESTFEWNVVPTGTATGNLTYSVSFAAGPGAQGKVVTRTLEVPALPTQPFLGGISMVSFPFHFDDPTPAAALGLNQLDFDLLRWNPLTGTYEPVSRLVPGQGYWLRLAGGRTINLQGARPVTVGINPFEIKLSQGWQQIGNPYLYRVRWADIQVINTDVSDPQALTPISILEAAQRGWILPTIYRYDAALGEYTYDIDLITDLIPFEGYWVRSLRPDISLLIPPTTGRAARIAGKSRGVTVPGGWTLRIAANGDKSADTYNFIGLAPGAQDGIDRYDVEKPPAPQGKVTLGIVRPNWGRRAGVYTTDIQANGGRKLWDLVVTTPGPNEFVTLSWPEISRLPKSYELFITDKASGERKMMRQAASLRVNTGASATRAYTITAEPRSGPNTLRVTADVSLVGGGTGRAATSARILTRASTDATYTLRVLGSNGQVIRHLVQGRAAAAGKDNTATWDLRDSKGVSVPSGLYSIEVKAVTPDGLSAKDARPFVIVR